ncbi:NH(3)-dependent NAD(+) synthetase [Desulforamulus reducens MI-1]|uniref:NH(3)-dependent NAD(+) synthetase n=1 Tax=Desulforamulus reducens (strain ATCC BAA-1160 / DSM 100696 / MI-1) TaxID=349161 RepID=A4J532_DESRM|nr:NAD(+) synthase [Desulforamulus reducens]ABO50185.1 NH(3)-dependent NAD(+) synthetase [Desulforamulus reducens MI-1]
MKDLAEKLSQWVKDEVEKAGAQGAVVGLSGGIDSSCVAALCKRAFPDNVLGVIMPCYSNPEDAADAKLLAKTLSVPYEEIELDEPFDWFIQRLTGQDYDIHSCDLSIVNIKPRLRMTTLYYYSNRHNYLVVGTTNKAEMVVGHYTKYGDGGADILPLANLAKSEVRALAKELGIPQRIIDKAPSAGLWFGHCDEKEMGISYEALDQYILTGDTLAEAKRTIQALEKKREHKRFMPPTPPVR